MKMQKGKRSILQKKGSPMRYTKNIKSSQSPHNEMRHPLLHQRKRTQSQISQEGNTIDMVRLARRNEESRLSLVNIDHSMYRKYNTLSNGSPNRKRFSESNRKEPEHQMNRPKQEDQDDMMEGLGSTLVHMGTNNIRNSQVVEHYIRPSNVNLLSKMNRNLDNSTVLGIVLLTVFLILLSLQIITSSYLMNASKVILQNYNFIIVLNYLYNGELFLELQRYNFMVIAMFYLGIECLYHLIVWCIQSYSENKSKLMDKESASLQYIMQCRSIRRMSNNGVEVISKRPIFTLVIMIVSVMLYNYSLIHCYYYSQFNELYMDGQTNIYSSAIIFLVEIFYFSIILPEAIKYVLLDKMHVGKPFSEWSSEESHKENQKMPPIPLTSFNLEKWWVKLLLVLLGLSFAYSIFTSFWLIILAFSKTELNFKKIKYKIDSFYVELIGKIVLILILALFVLTNTGNGFENFLTPGYTIECTLILGVSMLLWRVVGSIFIRQQLYRYLYTEMHLNFISIIWTFGLIYLIALLLPQIRFFTVETIVIGAFSFLLMISIYKEGSYAQQIKFNEDQRNSGYYIEMHNL